MNLPQQRRDLFKRYGLALVLAGLALFLRGVLPFREGIAPYQIAIVAVILSAWYGGRGPGWLASLICVAGAWYLFVPPVYSFTAPDHALPFAIFVGLCLLLTEFGAGRRRIEHGLRVSDERFRTLVQFSFDVYWETDAEHRFTRQEFSERLTDGPPRSRDRQDPLGDPICRARRRGVAQAPRDDGRASAIPRLRAGSTHPRRWQAVRVGFRNAGV